MEPGAGLVRRMPERWRITVAGRPPGFRGGIRADGIAGATGGIDQAEVTYDPAGYIFEGTITTVGAMKK